jgi:hypothetical protein
MDSKCTIRPHGLTDTLYVRLNTDFGFNDEHLWGGYADPNSMMFIFTPTSEYPQESYQVRAFRNFLSSERSTPYKAGDVVRIFDVLEKMNADNFTTQFFL